MLLACNVSSNLMNKHKLWHIWTPPRLQRKVWNSDILRDKKKNNNNKNSAFKVFFLTLNCLIMLIVSSASHCIQWEHCICSCKGHTAIMIAELRRGCCERQRLYQLWKWLWHPQIAHFCLWRQGCCHGNPAFLALRGDNKVEMCLKREGTEGRWGWLRTEGGWEIN